MSKIPTTVFDQAVNSSITSFGRSHTVSEFDNLAVFNGTCAAISSTGALFSTVTTRRPELDITYNCGFDDQGVIRISFSISGGWANRVFSSATTSLIESNVSILGTFDTGVIVNCLLSATAKLYPAETYVVFVDAIKANWIKWSDVGSLDFTIGRNNVAGERPLDWSGFVYCAKKLRNKLVAYGENGVSVLAPVGVVFGLEGVHNIGLKGKNAVAGTNSEHYFVDVFGSLFSMTETTKKLGYEEYLSDLNESIVLTFDTESKLLYICDGVKGFVYNTSTGSFGEGPENITGIGYKSGTTYVTASSAITTAPFEICTDIFDLGTRAGKTIFSIELGTDLTTGLYVSVDWRRDKAAEFTQTPWYTVSAQGRAIVVAYGREFRFRVKIASYEYFELDYIKVNGVADAY